MCAVVTFHSAAAVVLLERRAAVCHKNSVFSVSKAEGVHRLFFYNQGECEESVCEIDRGGFKETTHTHTYTLAHTHTGLMSLPLFPPCEMTQPTALLFIYFAFFFPVRPDRTSSKVVITVKLLPWFHYLGR